jgi:hypothetical protein
MVELLGCLEFGQRLLHEDFILGLLLPHHLERIALAPRRLVGDQQNGAARAIAKRIDHAIFHTGQLGGTGHFGHSVPRSRWCWPLSVKSPGFRRR